MREKKEDTTEKVNLFQQMTHEGGLGEGELNITPRSISDWMHYVSMTAAELHTYTHVSKSIHNGCIGGLFQVRLILLMQIRDNENVLQCIQCKTGQTLEMKEVLWALICTVHPTFTQITQELRHSIMQEQKENRYGEVSVLPRNPTFGKNNLRTQCNLSM